MRKFLIIFMCLIFAGLVTSTTVLAVKYSAEINKTEETQPTDTSGLVNTIEELQKLVKDLTAEKSELQVKANNLTAQNESLQAQISALQSQADSDKDTIQSLQQQLADNEALIDDLNSQISNLEASITYYEEYIQAFENENQVTATFVVDNKVISTPILNVGSKLTPPDVESTDTKTFLGWTVNDELVDTTTYTIQEDTTFVASFSYSYYATFISDEVQVSEVLVAEGSLITSLPAEPIKDGYNFLGWSSDKINVVDFDNLTISADITFYALWEEWARNGTYSFVAWHPYLTLQGDFTLLGSTVTYDSMRISDCSVYSVELADVSTGFFEEADANRLKISMYIHSSLSPLVYYFYFSCYVVFDTVTADTYSISLVNLYYAAEGTFKDSVRTTGESLNSNTTVTFTKKSNEATVTGDFSFTYINQTHNFFLVNVYIVNSQIMSSDYEVLNSNSTYNADSFDIYFVDSDTLYITFGTTYKDGTSYTWTSQFNYDFGNSIFVTEYSKFNNTNCSVAIEAI